MGLKWMTDGHGMFQPGNADASAEDDDSRRRRLVARSGRTRALTGRRRAGLKGSPLAFSSAGVLSFRRMTDVVATVFRLLLYYFGVVN